MPVLETKRLVLRAFSRDDAPELLALLGDEEANTFLPWFPVRNLEETLSFFEARLDPSHVRIPAYAYAVCLKGDDRPVGYVTVGGGVAHDLGYGLRHEFWHRGIATEACRAVVEQARRDGVTFLTATHDRDNPRSGGVKRNIGMSYCYSYEEQWQPKDVLVTFRMYQINLDGDADRFFRGYWDAAAVRMVEDMQEHRL